MMELSNRANQNYWNKNQMDFKLTCIMCLVLLPNLKGEAQHIENAGSIKTRIDNYLNSSVENGYSGSILVAKNGELLLSKGYGWADRNRRIPNEPQTAFNIGSVTKQFTAAAVLKLQELDKLKTSDVISKYFPQAPLDKQHITIHQLLTHTSGTSPQTGGFRYDEASKEQFLEEFFRAELIYKPGTKHTYANANYILLAAIIEEVAQQDYECFLREHFWDPLEMHHSGYKGVDFNNEQLAHGYYFNDSEGEWNDWGTTIEHLPKSDNHWYSIGKGDLYSSVEDLYKWHLALEQNKVLNADAKHLMETALVPENAEETSFYGYGWAIFNASKDSKIVTHNGSNGIYFADFIRFAKDDIVIIALSNVILNQQSELIAWEIASMIQDINYTAETIPKNTVELVFDFIRVNSSKLACELPGFIKEHTGRTLHDKAILNRIGFKQVSENKDTGWGIALLRLNTCLFPEDGNLWDSLAEGYYLLNEKENARACFEKALALKPEENCHWCDNATKRLQQLNK